MTMQPSKCSLPREQVTPETTNVLCRSLCRDIFESILNRNPSHRLPDTVLKPILAQVFLALDYMHTGYLADIKGDNILMEIIDESILEHLLHVKPLIPLQYMHPRFLLMYLNARGDKKLNHYAQPQVYRPPEVMLKAEWGYPVDIWKDGCMVFSKTSICSMAGGRMEAEIEHVLSRRNHLSARAASVGIEELEGTYQGKKQDDFLQIGKLRASYIITCIWKARCGQSDVLFVLVMLCYHSGVANDVVYMTIPHFHRLIGT
ncbi:uncharacterized protein BDR25DRAFT_358535 [Lindgomyces ingoldianus]|uniref:Uncharacterized protein n=1 Tax=Lindgomyces ingoldianus TaxID=673940 RepID=A0ACB6QKJ6_9PLEO|nr:uncharacterized protein BDR25DRAFT_358535 [Lindgomyces ingoldianus]KAF2467411.1 hypothetical protein BDR25DRAFT_358535 [Lindgomyces ingoldianus]